VSEPPSDPPHPLPLTGERTVPGVPDEAYWFARHVVAYEHALPLVGGRRVLDAGCGEGYGLRLLHDDGGATHVTGVDLDGPTVAHATATYGGPAVDVVAADLASLPLDDDTVDVTVSFQVVEHLHDVAAYLAELRRVTVPGGVVVLATPNRLTFTPDQPEPVNPFHVREFAPDELRVVLEDAGLLDVALLGVHHGLRIGLVEHATGHPFTDRLTTQAPQDWPPRFRALVRAVTPADFEVRADDLDTSLDLLATCRVP
jgi:SAM-dependent methyltransferase